MKLARIAVGTTLLTMSLSLSMAMAQDGQKKAPAPPGLAIMSPAFKDGEVIPDKFTQNAGPAAISPQLDWTNVPNGTVTFALIMHDPDVSLQKKTDDVLHWMAFNIPGSAKGLPENVPAGTATLPDGTVQAKNTRGTAGFLGPGAPANGPYHHYTMELFALDTKLDLGPDASRADVIAAMQGHIIGKGAVVGRFHR